MFVEPSIPVSDADRVRLLIRRAMLIACCGSAFLSAFIAAGILTVGGQIWVDDFAGIIQSISSAKGGQSLKLDNGTTCMVPFDALDDTSPPINLAIGDQVEKKYNSWEYLLNNRPLTDSRWAVHHYLLPTETKTLGGSYLVLCTVFAIAYRRNPLSEAIELKPPKTAIPFLLLLRAFGGFVFGWFGLVFAFQMALTLMATCIGGLLGQLFESLR
jgi:hypothetical protein